MSIDFRCFDTVHQFGESATGSIARFVGALAALFVVAERATQTRRNAVARPSGA
ncbi:hypothetical protein [Massilia genomosp. 1]|uniref:hypothetical protein n=1 Tax=Massilia genomosp. 1 TaxID=2609280 RepID=UPI00141D95A6|nr:hypothetical protein [Massilia genomosp. 1]